MDAAGPVDAQTRPPRLAKRADAFRTASTGLIVCFLMRNDEDQGTFLFREERGHFYFALTSRLLSH
jgi:hypothetical protein